MQVAPSKPTALIALVKQCATAGEFEAIVQRVIYQKYDGEPLTASYSEIYKSYVAAGRPYPLAEYWNRTKR